jgi:hypothetical protein
VKRLTVGDSIVTVAQEARRPGGSSFVSPELVGMAGRQDVGNVAVAAAAREGCRGRLHLV